jgi:nitrogen-specific signal transduction histidine kinase
MLREITQERNNQARIQMQDRLATVGQLAAGIAHDFNNVMATILVYSDLLRKDLATIPAGLERLAIIQHQVQRAASLIRQILDFSRRSVMEQSTLDILPFIKEFDKLLERVLPETIRVELNYHPGSYPVNADPTRLQQVLMNLAVNARDAMPDGGTLSFDINRVQLAPGDYPPSPYLPVGEWVSITVGDTGVGIPAEVIPHIYEPFFTTKPVGQGTGLGLAQAYGIVKQHEGYIDVQSQEGKGTRFTVYLPALPAEQIETMPVPVSVPVDGMGHTILVVEDDPTTLNAIQDLLEAQQYQVFTASNGNEAMQIFELNPDKIDLLISDLVMPEMGGLALYNQVQNRWPNVKTLFVTGHPMGDERQSLLEENQITWLQKPFSVPEFFFAVEELLTES